MYPEVGNGSWARRGDLVQGYRSFDEACAGVLHFLRSTMPHQLWAVTRVIDDRWVMLATDDTGYGITDGSTFRWRDTFCSLMVEGLGPQIAPDVRAVPTYLNAPIGRSIAIGSYVGVPMRAQDGELLGTLCAIDPSPQEIDDDVLPLLQVLAGLLGGLLARDIDLATVRRRAEQAERDAMVDPLTKLPNRRAWDLSVIEEERRCRQLGQSACVLLIDVDGLKLVNDRYGHAAGDDLLTGVAEALRSVLSEDDMAARLGGDEFGAILVHHTEKDAELVIERLRAALAAEGLTATVGVAERDRQRGLVHATELADRRMYHAKPTRGGRPDRHETGIAASR